MYIGGMRLLSPQKALPPALFLLLSVSSAFSASNVRKLALHDLDGNKTRLSQFQGRIVVLNFWATWCGPCKEELPRLGKLAQQYSKDNIVFVLVSIDEQKKLPSVREFVAQQRVALPVWVGSSPEQLEDLSGTNIVPATLIVDQKGEVVRAINGEAREEDVKQAVDWLLGGRTGPIPAYKVKRY
jgi:thiol-disulfide isomerase/thioredoxin